MAAWLDAVASLFSAKGDLLGTSDGNAVGVLPVGTDGQVLTADSAAPLGLAWDDAAVGGGGTSLDSVTSEDFTNRTCNTTTYADLAAVLSATVTVPASGKVLCLLSHRARNGGGEIYSRVDLGGANTLTSTTVGGEVTTEHYFSIGSTFSATTFQKLFTGLSPGSTTFTAKYARATASADVNNRMLTLITMP
jgi:hypothetical protein